MTDTPSLLIALGAGVLSFVSPCLLPLIPSYLSYITGLSLEEIRADPQRARAITVRHALAFVAGFSLIFLALGFSASLFATLFAKYGDIIRKVGGVFIGLMGLSLLGVIKLPWLTQERRLHLASKPTGYVGSVLVGITFAAGWVPCVGPILASVLAVAATRPGAGVPLLTAFSLGLAVPFVASAYALGQLGAIRRYASVTQRIGGAILMVMAVMLFTGTIQRLSSFLIDWTGFQGF
ncbi:MAG: sulfite exporter TauE/SafE family protein [Deinococcus sp.]|nr:sulfite exporter TauE/SafE family protein [Deinococcus sp.]